MRRRVELAALLLAIALLAAVPPGPAAAIVQQGGHWPKDWPPELERVRGQATTIGIATGIQEDIYSIPLRDGGEFRAIWHAVLRLKSPGGTLTLRRAGRGTDEPAEVSNRGPAVRIHAPCGGIVSVPVDQTGMGPLPYGDPPGPERLNEPMEQGRALRAGAPWPESAYLPNGELPEYVTLEERDGRLTWVPVIPGASQRQGFMYRARVDIELVVDGKVVDLNGTHLPPDTDITDERGEPQPVSEGGQAGAPEQAPEHPALADAYGWGPAEDGLQMGFFHRGDQREFSYGDTVRFVLAARNTRNEPLELRLEPRYADAMYPLVSVSAGNRLNLNTEPGVGPFVLRLAPGEERTVPGLELRATLCAPPGPERGPRPCKPGECAALLPGAYAVQFAHPLWIYDATDPEGRAVRHVRPGVARLTLRDDPANPWVTQRIVCNADGSQSISREMPGDAGAVITQLEGPPDPAPPTGTGVNTGPISWGEMVNGLQAGLRLEATPGRHAPEDTETAAGRFVFGFYLRNCTNRQAKVTLFDLAGVDWDWSPAITDSEGNRVEVTPHPSRIPLVRPSASFALAPGQCVRTNSLLLRLSAKNTGAADEDSAPKAAHDPVRPDRSAWESDLGLAPRAFMESGRYTVSCTPAASWDGGGCGEIMLPTGGVAVDVTAGDLGRERKAGAGGEPK